MQGYVYRCHASEASRRTVSFSCGHSRLLPGLSPEPEILNRAHCRCMTDAPLLCVGPVYFGLTIMGVLKPQYLD